jgi:hypothetical protein
MSCPRRRCGITAVAFGLQRPEWCLEEAFLAWHEDDVEVLAAIDDDARADELPRKARAAAAWDDGHGHLGADLHGDDVGCGRGMTTPSGSI